MNKSIIVGIILILIAISGFFVFVPQEKPYNYKETMKRIIAGEPPEDVLGEEIVSCKCEPKGDLDG